MTEHLRILGAALEADQEGVDELTEGDIVAAANAAYRALKERGIDLEGVAPVLRKDDPAVATDGGRTAEELADELEDELVERLRGRDGEPVVFKGGRLADDIGMDKHSFTAGIAALRERDASRVDVDRWRSDGPGRPWEATLSGATLAADGGQELGVECDVDDCEERPLGLDDGYEFSRGVVCQSCIDYQSRHGHWPDEEAEICVECKIDDGAVRHECDEAASLDSVLVDAGDDCPYCGEEQRKVATDGGDVREWAERTIEEIDELPDATFEAVRLDARFLREQGLSVSRIIENRREHGRRAPMVAFDPADPEVVV